mgnify:CR=1 FL=1
MLCFPRNKNAAAMTPVSDGSRCSTDVGRRSWVMNDACFEGMLRSEMNRHAVGVFAVVADLQHGCVNHTFCSCRAFGALGGNS